jgi:hypothetical protein
MSVALRPISLSSTWRDGVFGYLTGEPTYAVVPDRNDPGPDGIRRSLEGDSAVHPACWMWDVLISGYLPAPNPVRGSDTHSKSWSHGSELPGSMLPNSFELRRLAGLGDVALLQSQIRGNMP